MRHSALKHTLAVLRNVTGEKQGGFASLVGCSLQTIQSIETGRLKLSRALAERIACETDVDFKWLMANDVKKPIVDHWGKPYTKMTYDVARMYMEDIDRGGSWEPSGNTPDWTPIRSALFAVAQVISAVFSLSIEGAQKGKLRLVHFKLVQALRDLKEELKFTRPLALERVWYAGEDASRFQIQKVADLFWEEMVAALKAEPEVYRARQASAKTNPPSLKRAKQRPKPRWAGK